MSDSIWDQLGTSCVVGKLATVDVSDPDAIVTGASSERIASSIKGDNDDDDRNAMGCRRDRAILSSQISGTARTSRMSTCEADGVRMVTPFGYACDYSQSEAPAIASLRSTAERAGAAIDWCGQGDNPCDAGAQCVSAPAGYECVDRPATAYSEELPPSTLDEDIGAPDVLVASEPELKVVVPTVDWARIWAASPRWLFWLVIILTVIFVLVLACVGAIALFSPIHNRRFH